ncbi:MAG: type II toxin-antitoxin system VapC family toxin, partial [Waterburya sp.]
QTIESLPKIITTSYIFDEIVTYFNSRNYHAKAVQVGNSLLQSAFVEMIQVDEQLFNAGWSYFQKHQDKQYSLTDCISFIVMEKLDITIAFSFDKHFLQAGFLKQP